MRFRSSKSQARSILAKKLAIGEKKPKGHGRKKSLPSIHSQTTYHVYTVALAHFARHAKRQWQKALIECSEEEARAFLKMKQKTVSQKTLDTYRLAINKGLNFAIERLKSKKTKETPARAYTLQECHTLALMAPFAYGVAIELGFRCGLRASETLTITPLPLFDKAKPRPVRSERFKGLSGTRYMVTGKGGLPREVMVPDDLKERLESLSMRDRKPVYNRGARFIPLYDLPGGAKLSSWFHAFAKKTIGKSHGFHGLRHTYAQTRLHDLCLMDVPMNMAMLTVSEELGHFREKITSMYTKRW
jgi:integrase